MSSRMYPLFLVMCLLFVSGCSTAKVRHYVMVKDRVDIDEGGNSGYLMGNAPPRGEIRPTRKVYVLEVTTEDNDQLSDMELETYTPAAEPRAIRDGASLIDPSIPSAEELQRRRQASMLDPAVNSSVRYIETKVGDFGLDDDYVQTNQVSSAMTSSSSTKVPLRMIPYTIEEGDTLQKVSKKFYDRYSQWARIYDYNKEVLKNPNVLKPGTKIQVPIYE